MLTLYPSIVTPILPPVALPIIVQPCMPDYIEHLGDADGGLQVVNPIAFAEYDGITYFCSTDMTLPVISHEENQNFSPVLVTAPVIVTSFDYVEDPNPTQQLIITEPDQFRSPFVAPPSTFVKNWDFFGPDFFPLLPDISAIPGMMERRIYTPTVTASMMKSLLEIWNLTARLDVKLATDQGSGVANASDVGGTVFTFNKPFKSVKAPVATVQETTDFTCVVDFVGIPNPTFFKVLVFNTAGVRATKTIYWVARGII